MSTSAPTLADSQARPAGPYKGLAPFEDSELDELLFFGRERERQVIAANLVAARLTVLYGPSGVGKSSVLRAGVARDLRMLPERPLVIVCDTWADNPEAALAAAIAAAAGIDPGPLSETVDLAAALHDEIYVLFDQVEEYFVYHGADPALGDALAELVTRSELPVHVLVGIREDALARLDSFKPRLPGLLANRLRLDHLSFEAGRRAILGPVERFVELVPEEGGFEVEPELVDAVLVGVRTGVLVAPRRGRGAAKAARKQDRIETPYLQVVMERLWEVEREQGSRVLRYETLERLGGPTRIVEQHLERALTALTYRQKGLAARMFNHLVTPSGMKIAHGTRDLARYADASEDELAPVLITLGQERILRSTGGDGPEVAHEIFHDVLADAVLAWRAAFEAEEALRLERLAARRRHRRLLVIIVLSLLALAAMAAVTLYAVSQRSAAQRSAAAAQQRLVEAKQAKAQASREAVNARKSAGEAKAEAKRARKAQANAVKARKEALRQEGFALEQKQVALKQRQFALDQKLIAVGQTQKADQATKRALQQQKNAELQKARAQAARKTAEAKTQEAIRARANEQHAKLTAQARALAFDAVTLLDSRPESSLKLGIDAARLEPGLALVEQTLRRALLAARGLHVLPASDGQMRDAAFGGDGSLIVTEGNTDVQVFAAGTGTLASTIHAGGNVRSASFAPDGRTVLVAASGRHAQLWDSRSGVLIGALAQGGAATSAHFSDDGHLAVTARAASARIWDVASRSEVRVLAAPATIRSVTFSPDGSRLLVIADSSAYVYGVATGALLFSLSSPVTAARFSRLGDTIATTGGGAIADLWNAQDGSHRCTTRPSDGALLSSAFSHDGQWLVTASVQGDTRVWSTANCELQTQLIGQLSRVVAAEFAPNDRLIVTAGSDGSARLFSFPDGTQRASLLGHGDALVSARFSPDGTRVVTASNDGTARIWNAEVDRVLQVLGNHQGSANGLAFSSNGATLASAGSDGDVRLWDLATRKQLAPLVAGVPLNGVAFSPDGQKLAAAGADGVTRIWTLARGLVTARKQQPGVDRAVAYSPDGAWLATAGDDQNVRIWPVRGGAPIVLAQPAGVRDVTSSADSTSVATAGEDGVARLWNIRTGELGRTFRGHTAAVTSVAFSPDGSKLVTASLDHDARIWDVANGRTLRVLHGHAAFVSDAGFSADGNWVVTAGPGAAGVWATAESDLANFRLFFLAGHEGPLTAAAFDPHGWLLATAGTDGTIRTYTCALCAGTPELIHLAKQRLAALGLD